MNVKRDIIKWAKWLKPTWKRRWCLGYQWGGPADPLNHTTAANLPPRQVLCASCGGGKAADGSKHCLQPVTTQNTILGLKKQVATQHHLYLRHCYYFSIFNRWDPVCWARRKKNSSQVTEPGGTLGTVMIQTHRVAEEERFSLNCWSWTVSPQVMPWYLASPPLPCHTGGY